MGKRWGLRYKKMVLEYARLIGSDAKSYRDFEVPKSTFYRWKHAFAAEGESGLIRKKPVARSHLRQLSSVAVDKILHLRRIYHLGPERIMWYLARYHGIETSCATVYRTLIRHDMRCAGSAESGHDRGLS